MKHDLHVENIKCSGCAHSIVTSLSKVKGVHQVTVDVENGSIQLDMDEVSTLEAVIEKLHHSCLTNLVVIARNHLISFTLIALCGYY
jgi:copper chaperone CopZ